MATPGSRRLGFVLPSGGNGKTSGLGGMDGTGSLETEVREASRCAVAWHRTEQRYASPLISSEVIRPRQGLFLSDSERLRRRGGEAEARTPFACASGL